MGRSACLELKTKRKKGRSRMETDGMASNVCMFRLRVADLANDEVDSLHVKRNHVVGCFYLDIVDSA